MKTTKEFPATHSMSTEWFIADEDGNIALMSFDENGPVPENIPPESDSYLMTAENDFGEKDSDSIEFLELTDEQVEELMNQAVPVSEYNLEEDYSVFVQVLEQNKREFLDIFIDRVNFCLSHKHGIYYLDSIFGYGEPKSYQERSKETFLKTVKRAIQIAPDAYMWEENGNPLQNWPLPFYCYKQPYSSYTELAERINVPKYPFKEQQISEAQRKKLIRVPLKFSECTGLQIAQYVICGWYAGFDDKELNGKEYTKFPKTEGGYGYFLRYQIPEKDGDKPIILNGGI